LLTLLSPSVSECEEGEKRRQTRIVYLSEREKGKQELKKYRNGCPSRRLRSQNPTPYPRLRPLAPPVFARPLPTDAATRASPPVLHAVWRGHRAAAGGDPVEQGAVQLGAAHRDGRHRRRTAAAAQRRRRRKGAPRRLEVGDRDHMVFLIYEMRTFAPTFERLCR
jgi:hypothetical protein